MKLIYVGGPTAVLELGGLRLLTDPTFDPAGGVYVGPTSTLTKLAGPAIAPESIGRIDVVLLSHDHHLDNLDHAGRALLASAGRVLTTPAGAERLDGNAAGLANWASVEIPAPGGGALRVTGTPARHGPAGGDRGPVTGFVLELASAPGHAVYVSGDTVWYEGAAEVAQRFDVATALLFMGAARVPAAGMAAITMTAADGIEAARALGGATIVPLHFEGWAHFTEGHDEIARAFDAAELAARLRWPVPGAPIDVPPSGDVSA